MPEARDGDVGVYEMCLLGSECYAHREGYEHAHLVMVERESTEEEDGDGTEDARGA